MGVEVVVGVDGVLASDSVVMFGWLGNASEVGATICCWGTT